MEAYLTCRSGDLEEQRARDLHGPMFFKLFPPSRFASPPEEPALQVLQAKQILRGKKLLQAGIREEAAEQGRPAAMGTVKSPAAVIDHEETLPLDADTEQLMYSTAGAPKRMDDSTVQVSFDQQVLQHKMNRSGQKSTSEMLPNVQSHMKPLKKGSVVTLQDREEKGNETEQNCCSKSNPEGPFEERDILLSTGRSVSILVNPTFTKTCPVAVAPSRPRTPASGKDAEKAQGTATLATVESLKHDNYYTFAAGGLCAVATTKGAWEYLEEPGQRRLERCLEEQFKKYPKNLEFNSIAAEHRQRGKANDGGEKPQSPQTGSIRHQNDLHHRDVGRRATGTAMMHTSHQRTSAARDGSTVQELPDPGASSRGQRLAANSRARRATPPNLEAIRIQHTSEFPVAATPTSASAESKMEIAGEKVAASRHVVTPERPLVANSSGGPLQSYQRTNLGEGGVSSSLGTVTPVSRSGGDVTVASTAAPTVVQEPLNDLDVEDAAPVTVSGSTAVATETPGTGAVVCVTTVNHIEIKTAAEKGEDTRNDTAIARVLQFEENEQAGLPHPSTHVPGTRGGSGSHTSSEDYRLARQMQQEYDAEMAFLVQQEEERESRARRYNSPYDERADRRNMPSAYSTPPADNNANARHHDRVYGSQGYHSSSTYDHHYPREEEGGERHMWRRGLGTVVATRHDPPQAHVHEEMDMSYEALSQLKDVSRGLNQATISRMSETYRYESKQNGTCTDRRGDETAPQDAKCCICLQQFEAGQQLRSLPCIHAFHRHCIDQWLTENKHCPVCMKDILDFAHQFV